MMSRMPVPPQLRQDIRKLEARGFVIKVIEGQETGIVFKGYPVPAHIWNSESVDLLVMTYSTYPNPKMDMFWVHPALSLKNGNSVKATEVETKYGREWQRFSWHVDSWNPAYDNIITYLDVINDRLGRNE